MSVKNTIFPPRHSKTSERSGQPEHRAVQGKYRLRKTIAGKVAFAEVNLSLQQSLQSKIVFKHSPADAAKSIPAQWIQAALRGARVVLIYLAKEKLISNNYTVTITKIVGSVSDTRTDAIECASGLSVWNAVTEMREPQILRARRLRLDLPKARSAA